MQKRRSVVFLYSRLPDYFYSCICYFSKHYDVDVAIVRYRQDQNTRYSFSPADKVVLKYKDETDLASEVASARPSAIFVSGWSDKEYRAIARQYRNSIPVIVGIDNLWLGTVRQRVLALASYFFLRPLFNAAWVAGDSQYTYARKLGFRARRIIKDLYSADTPKFYNNNVNDLAGKKEKYPHTIVFLGRLVEYKQPDVLARIFSELVAEHSLDWKLIIAGEGPLKTSIEEAAYREVEVTGFVQPADIPSFYRGAGVFCLPSINEHWGVAVHEAAAAGLPLLLSDGVHSSSAFLNDGKNGFIFKADDAASFKASLLRMMQLSDHGLLRMSQDSIAASKVISQESWANSLFQILTMEDGRR